MAAGGASRAGRSAGGLEGEGANGLLRVIPSFLRWLHSPQNWSRPLGVEPSSGNRLDCRGYPLLHLCLCARVREEEEMQGRTG